jgi:hypothetical protein
MRTAMLNELRNEVLVTYGCLGGWSRVNMGPCGRFAKAFREEWNSQFQDSVNIVFMMNLDGTECKHVLVRLPEGNLFDAGLGVVTDSALHTIMPGNHFEEMTVFDYELLDKRSYGLNRSYTNCPNYSDDLTRSLLQRHFSKVPREMPAKCGKIV